ncbi:MAG: XrtA-associated tyrosine autokinase [Porticoccus sp.]|nr:XrtA-associated tyrosine autokinase [Porticoccus sp.]
MSTIEKAVEKLGRQSPPQEQEVASTISVHEERHSDLDVFPECVEVPDDSGMIENRLEQTESEPESTQEIFQLPLSRLESMGFVSTNNPRSHIAEEFRGIKRPLLMNIDRRSVGSTENANLIMVTSSYEGEGKTFSAVNLMLSISMEKNKTVLFVDADIAKASAGKVLGIPDDAPGFVDVIEHENVGFEDVILKTNIPNVRIIPAGKVTEHSTELLASDRMEYLMKELSGRYPDRIIIFDSPPFLQTSEASVLANFMGQVVFVVESEKTSPDMVSQAVSQIADDKIIGLVLNKTRKYPWDRHLHGYGYGYGYGYGADSGRARAIADS